MTYITIFGTFFFWFTITGTDYSWSKWKYSCFFIWMNMIRSLIIRIMSRLICCWCRVLDGFKLNWARKITLRITRESTLKKFCSIIFLVLLLYFFNFMVDISIKGNSQMILRNDLIVWTDLGWVTIVATLCRCIGYKEADREPKPSKNSGGTFRLEKREKGNIL